MKLNLRFLGPIKMGFVAHKSTQKWGLGIFTDISFISVIFSLDLFIIRQALFKTKII